MMFLILKSNCPVLWT